MRHMAAVSKQDLQLILNQLYVFTYLYIHIYIYIYDILCRCKFTIFLQSINDDRHYHNNNETIHNGVDSFKAFVMLQMEWTD